MLESQGALHEMAAALGFLGNGLDLTNKSTNTRYSESNELIDTPTHSQTRHVIPPNETISLTIFICFFNERPCQFSKNKIYLLNTIRAL